MSPRSWLLALVFLSPLRAFAALPGTPLPDTPLRNFQVQEPLPLPEHVKTCTVTLVRHLFANSYGQPAIVGYVPPTECGAPGTWSTVVMNFTATSNGTQYDRLANVYLENTEIWRTSTPEPTPKGIVWTALKDVTRYTSLLAKSGSLLLDLGNIIDLSQGLTGVYDVTLSATYYSSSGAYPTPTVADVILPISSQSPGQGGVFHAPPAAQANLTLPQNGARAFVEVHATGSGDEEFWYGNVPDEFFSQLPTWSAPDGYASGKGPFREVQLLVDGTLTGVVFPYPVIYSGEFLPSIWRPMMSYGAFDSPTYYIDVTPFLPLLSDGSAHNFTLDVVGMGANRSINADWIVSGNVQVFLDASDKPTTGRITSYSAVPYVDPQVEGHVEGPSPNVTVRTTAARTLDIEAEITTGSGKRTLVSWHQDMKFSNSEVYRTTSTNISVQTVEQASTGGSYSTHDATRIVSDTFAYPFSLELTYNQTGSFYDYSVALDHAYDRALTTPGAVPRTVHTRQHCDGSQYAHSTAVRIRTGKTTETFSYADARGNTFFEDVGVQTLQNTTINATTVSDSALLYDRRSGTLAKPAN